MIDPSSCREDGKMVYFLFGLLMIVMIAMAYYVTYFCSVGIPYLG